MLRMAEMIRDATQVGENTAVRVGTEIYDIVVELSRMLDMMDDKSGIFSIWLIWLMRTSIRR